jgi:serine/threonine protein kinase
MFRYSMKSDVFSYGVVIAQLVTGRSQTEFSGLIFEGSIGQWLRKCLQSSDGAIDAIDPALRGSRYEDEILRAMKVAVVCTDRDPVDRPTSSEALKMLLQIRNPDTVPSADCD